MLARVVVRSLALTTLAIAQPALSQTTGAIVGEIRAFAISNNNADSLNALYAGGWVPADGRSLPKTQFSALNKALGNTWGAAADAASFLVPDLRGLFLRGYNGSSTRDPDAANRTASVNGGATGNAVGSFQLDALQVHRHLDAGHTHALNQTIYTGGTRYDVPAGPYPQGGGGALTSATGYAQIGDPTGARTSTETRPANVAVYYFVYTGRAIPPGLRRAR